ncbi:MAG TPA: hypothetical protein VLZ03_01410 [Thermodesulfobacteriota bacterium]|nr:hypothetical protein [Thermodesulfobacteriota bacterium]
MPSTYGLQGKIGVKRARKEDNVDKEIRVLYGNVPSISTIIEYPIPSEYHN